jgi:iron complex transport system substrate-binding protein
VARSSVMARVPFRSLREMSATLSKKLAGIAIVIAALLALAGCGSSPTKSSKDSGSFPVTLKSAGADVTVKSKPHRIVSLSPTATEDLFAVDADQQVVAVDNQSTYPAKAPKTSLSGLTPNAEAIAKYRPDLVVISNNTNGIAGNLQKLGITVLTEPAATTLDDVYAQITDLGRATGHTDVATQLANNTRNTINTAISSAPRFNPPLKAYHEVDNTYYSVTSSTFIGQIYKRMGLDNIADAADKTGSGYPQLSQEYIVSSNPDVVFLADSKCCAQSATTLEQRPGWNNIKALQMNNGVVSLDDDVASRWGPRTADLVVQIQTALQGWKTPS